MEKLNLQNNNLNPRQYIYTKYAFSIGYFLLILAVFMFYLGPTSKDIIPVNNIIITDVVILLISLILFIFFLLSRFSLHKKSNYKLDKKDQKWYILTFLFVFTSFVVVVIWLSIVKNVDNDSSFVWWIISLVIMVIMSFSASVLEYLARFNEFSKVATIFEAKAKENDLIIAQQYSSDHETAESIFNNDNEFLNDGEDRDD